MQNLITSATFGGDSVLTAVCTSICLLVKRITQKLWVDFSEIWGKVDYGPEKRWLKFWKWCGRFPGYLGYRKFISNSVRAAAKIFIWRITFPFTSFPSLLSAPFLLEVGLLIQLRGLGERCKLFQRVRAEPDRQTISGDILSQIWSTRWSLRKFSVYNFHKLTCIEREW